MATTSTMNAAPPPAPTLDDQREDATTAVSLNHQKKRSAVEEPSSLTMKSFSTKNVVEKETKDRDDDEQKNDDDDDDDCDESTTIFDKDFNATSIADHLSSRLEQAFTSSVAQLPMLRQPNVLLQRLRHSYLRNVDIFEVYCSRNLFTLDKLSSSNSKRLRQRVVQLFREIKHSSDVVFPSVFQNDDNNKTSAAAVVHPLVLPEQAANNNDGSPPLLASADGAELQALQDEITTLRERLVTAQQTRGDLRRSLDEIEQAERLADMALEALAAQTQGQQQLDHRKLHDSMTAVAVGAQGLLLYEQQGRDHLLEHISNNSNNNNQRNRSEIMMTSNGDHDENNAWNCMLLADKKKPLSIVELYQQEKEHIVVVATAPGSNGGGAAAADDDLAKVQQLILGQRQDN